MGSSLSPETFFRPSPIRDIPNRKSAMPLRSAITCVISTASPFVKKMNEASSCRIAALAGSINTDVPIDDIIVKIIQD
jgi:hypothetical protein